MTTYHVTITFANDPISAILRADHRIDVSRFLDLHDCLLDNGEYNRLMLGNDVFIVCQHNGYTTNATITLD